MSTFGSRLLELIVARGINQSRAALDLDTSPGFLSDVIRDVKKPGLEFLTKLKDVYGVSIDYLVSGRGAAHGAPPIDLQLHLAIIGCFELIRAALIHRSPVALSDLDEFLGIPPGEPLLLEGRASRLFDWAGNSEIARIAAAAYNTACWAPSADARIRSAITTAMTYFQSEAKFSRPDSSVPQNEGATSASALPNLQLAIGESVRFAGRDYHEYRDEKRAKK